MGNLRLGVESLVVTVDTTTVFLVKRMPPSTDGESEAAIEDRTVSATYTDGVIVPIEPLRSSTSDGREGLVFPAERTVDILGL